MTINSIKYLPLFKHAIQDVAVGSFGCSGGESHSPYQSCNLSYGVGDSEIAVRHNRERIKKYLGVSSLVSAHQVHGDTVHHVNMPLKKDYTAGDCDALTTNRKGVGLMIGHADCQAVMMYDKKRCAIAAVHNGWRGSVANIIATVISAMRDEYGTDPADLVAGVGPSLGPCCSQFVNYNDELPESFGNFKVSDNYFDFWQITTTQLIHCGVPSESITTAGICTSCSADFFSYRRSRREADGVTGRNGSVIVMHEGI